MEVIWYRKENIQFPRVSRQGRLWSLKSRQQTLTLLLLLFMYVCWHLFILCLYALSALDTIGRTSGRVGDTGISGLMRGLVTLPQGGSRSLQWSETGMEDPKEDPLAVYCFCVCSGSALLGSPWVIRSRECDLLSILSIYPRFFLCIFIVYCRILFCYMLMSIWFSYQYLPPPPFPFGRICFVVLVMRKGEESS